jgi:hypothetical protein
MSPISSSRGSNNRVEVPEVPTVFADEFDDSNWIPMKEARSQKFSKRVTSKKISNVKRMDYSFSYEPVSVTRRFNVRKSHTDKAKPLDPHVFSEIFGAVHGACATGQQVYSNADMALKVAQTINDAKEAIKYPGSDYKSFEDNVTARIEDIIALIAGLSAAKNFGGFLSVIHLYLRTHYPHPVSKKLWNG